MDGFWPNLQKFIIGWGKKCWLHFDDLDPIFKVTRGLRFLEKAGKFLVRPYLLKEQMDFDHTCTSRLLGHVKELIRFWWPWPHFQGRMKNGLSAPYLLNEWMDFYPTCTSVLLRHGKELIRFWWPWPHFQGHRRAQIVGKWLVCTLSHEGMDRFWPNLTTILLWHEKGLIRFWWPWPHF